MYNRKKEKVLSNFNNKCYKKGNPKKMIVFIHGYNGSPESINYAVQSLYEKIEDAVIVVPRAPFPCEKDEKNLQWLKCCFRAVGNGRCCNFVGVN